MSSASLLVATVVLPSGFFLLGWGLFSLRVALPPEATRGTAGQDWDSVAASSGTALSDLDPADMKWKEDPDEVRLRKSVAVRLLKPVIEKLAVVAKRYTPAGLMESLSRRLVAGGGLWGLSAEGLVALVVVLGGVGAFLGAGLAGLEGLSPTQSTMLILGLGMCGCLYPIGQLNTRVRKRKLEISEALPNAIDLLTIGIEAGLTFDAGIQQVTVRYDNELSAEFKIMLSELNFGRSRDQALSAVAERSDVDDLRIFVQAVIQSTETGGSLGQILRVQAFEARRRRRQRAQELGAKAPIKMILPMVGCIFPAIFVVLLGPSVIIVGHSLMGQ